MEEEFLIGDVVDVAIYPAGPSRSRELGTITGTVYNAGSECDVEVVEEERHEAREFLNSIESDLGDLVAQDFWLLRNCQSNQLSLVGRPDPGELALEALGEMIDWAAEQVGEEFDRYTTLRRARRIYEQVSKRIVT